MDDTVDTDASVADAPRKTRPPTTPFTWACTVAVLLAAAGGGYWWYVTLGPGRTIDTSGIQPGMSRLEVATKLGDPDEFFTVGEETAMRYGRTHIWLKGGVGRGGTVSEITVGPR